MLKKSNTISLLPQKKTCYSVHLAERGVLLVKHVQTGIIAMAHEYQTTNALPASIRHARPTYMFDINSVWHDTVEQLCLEYASLFVLQNTVAVLD
jgi:hypothetical protein